ncbi:MAG: cytochrome c [Bacteroidota bacterium]
MNKSSRQFRIRVLIGAAIPFFGVLFVLFFMDNGPKRSGKKSYEKHCGNCHGAQGEGLRNLYPPLAGSDYLLAHEADLPCIIRYGLQKTIQVNGVTFDQPMAGLELPPAEIAAIINYMHREFKATSVMTSTDEVRNKLKRCPGAPKKQR